VNEDDIARGDEHDVTDLLYQHPVASQRESRFITPLLGRTYDGARPRSRHRRGARMPWPPGLPVAF
jgi:hypothetical protein